MMKFAWFSRIRRRNCLSFFGMSLLFIILLAGCYVSPYPPPGPYPYDYGPSSYDRSFRAAQDAMQDAGVRIVSSDWNGGVIRGTRDGVDATVNVKTQADGRVRVEFQAKEPLADQIYRAYERRMGR